jgi:hypothetical protein
LVALLDGSDATPAEMIVVASADSTTNKAYKMAYNPEYDTWISRVQIFLGYLLQSLFSEVLPHVHRIEHAAEVWQAVEEMFAS